MSSTPSEGPPTVDTLDTPIASRSGFTLERGSTVGRYVVIDQLGAGGMGVVYKAYDPELNRPIALKLLMADGEQAARDRLLREAQALAQLSHPNVIAVHDVGSFGARVFIATEFIEGLTVRQWLKQLPRTEREVLQVFRAAGEGLAAAHRAGMVHRDFKPDNVMVGSDGRVRVLDFGLVRASALDAQPVDVPGASAPSEAELTLGNRPGARQAKPVPVATPAPFVAALPSSHSQSTDRLSSPLTHVGSIMGTPRYMAPEQHLGEVADARADQFSFCVSMYEALYGAPPFEGVSPPLMRDAVLAGKIAAPPPGTRVPRWLRLVLLRGLASKPEARYPSMEALLGELDKIPARARRRWLVGGGVLSMIALAGVGLQLQRSRAVVCKAPAAELADVWGDGPRAAVSAAFRKTRSPGLEASLQATVAALDGYADAWKAMRFDACAATRLRGDQSEPMLDLRMECLAQRRRELGAVVSLLASADVTLVTRGDETVKGLSDLAICANARALRAPVRPPNDAATQAKVGELRDRLASANALVNAARFADALVLMKPLIAEALALHYLPLQSEALYLRGRIEARLGDAKTSEATFREVLATAVESGHDEMAARATDALSAIACDGSRFNEALLFGRLAQSFVNRVGVEGIEDNIQIGLGNIYEVQGQYAEAQAAYERALAIRQKRGADEPTLGHPLLGLGLVLYDRARYAEALATYQRGLAIQEKSLPAGHPDMGMTLSNIAETLMHLKRLDEAKATAERARGIFEKALGAEHPYTIAARTGLSVIQLARGDYMGGLPVMRGLVAQMDKAFGADSPDAATPHALLGEALRKAAQPAAATAELEHALAVLEKALGASHPRLAEPLVSLGRAAFDLHQSKVAVESLKRALAIGIADPALEDEARAALDRAQRSSP